MSDAAKQAKASKPRTPPEHPKYEEMISAAIIALKERSGSSRQAIVKYVTANYKVDPDKAGTHVKIALKRMVTSQKLKQTKGTGASGSFRVVKAAVSPKPKAKKVAAPKKPAAKKPKKPAAKPKAKKVVKKKAASPKKSVKKVTKKPAAKKSPAKPKKATTKKTVAKKPAAKKAATKAKPKSKKSPAKKTASKKK